MIDYTLGALFVRFRFQNSYRTGRPTLLILYMNGYCAPGILCNLVYENAKNL